MFATFLELIWEPPRDPHWYEIKCPCVAVVGAGIGGFFLHFIFAKVGFSQMTRALGLKLKGWIVGGEILEEDLPYSHLDEVAPSNELNTQENFEAGLPEPLVPDRAQVL